MADVAERIADDRVWLSTIADEVGERMLNGPLRQRLSVLLTTMLFQRSRVHGEALGVLSGALAELQEEWRTLQGGKDGGPTPTEELLRMVEKASRVVKDSEEAVQRTIKLALEEQRAQHEYADGIGATLFTGTGESLDMPAGLPPGDRETIRNLLSLVGKAANEAGTINVEGTPTPSPQGGPHPQLIGDDQSTLIGDEQTAHDGGSMRIADEGNAPHTPSPLIGDDPTPPPTRGATPSPTKKAKRAKRSTKKKTKATKKTKKKAGGTRRSSRGSDQ